MFISPNMAFFKADTIHPCFREQKKPNLENMQIVHFPCFMFYFHSILQHTVVNHYYIKFSPNLRRPKEWLQLLSVIATGYLLQPLISRIYWTSNISWLKEKSARIQWNTIPSLFTSFLLIIDDHTLHMKHSHDSWQSFNFLLVLSKWRHKSILDSYGPFPSPKST